MIRTELEYCVLGVIWRFGPCSAHVVRSEFATSPTAHWSASAGSIYPVVKRLEAAGLIEATSRPGRRRRITDLSISAAGLADLRAWVLRMDRSATSASYDSVRTRLLFIRSLGSAAERREAFDAALAGTKARLGELQSETDEDPMEQLARIGAIHELKGRLLWLSEVERQLLG
jgi:DNA-binding PadR family transcriptional regulator